MLNISIRTIGKPLNEVADELDAMAVGIMQDISIAGKNTMDYMIGIIEARTSRTQGEHRDTIPLTEGIKETSEITSIPNGVFVGIGDIEKLNYSCKHWAFLNYGHMRDGNTIPARGKFVPGYWENDKFIYEPGCGTGMKPGTPIFGLTGGHPMNYIEEGDNYITKEIKEIMTRAKLRMV